MFFSFGWILKMFCFNVCFMSTFIFRMLINMKKQLAHHLRTLRFLDSDDCKAKAANRNSNNEDLVRAIICAGLYPNVAQVHIKNRGRESEPILSTLTDRRVVIHPKSINATETKFRYPWMVYHLKMKSTSTYVHDCSEVSPMSLIFFGKGLFTDMRSNSNTNSMETIAVDPFVKFSCMRETSGVFKALRKALDELLQHKVAHPGPANWNIEQREGAILHTINELLSIEPESSQISYYDDDDGQGEEF